MKLPRDIGGAELAGLLSRYGYSITRKTGSHIRLTSTLRGTEHHITIPEHKPLKIGTLNAIIKDVSAYLDRDKQDIASELFE